MARAPTRPTSSTPMRSVQPLRWRHVLGRQDRRGGLGLADGWSGRLRRLGGFGLHGGGLLRSLRLLSLSLLRRGRGRRRLCGHGRSLAALRRGLWNRDCAACGMRDRSRRSRRGAADHSRRRQRVLRPVRGYRTFRPHAETGAEGRHEAQNPPVTGSITSRPSSPRRSITAMV